MVRHVSMYADTAGGRCTLLGELVSASWAVYPTADPSVVAYAGAFAVVASVLGIASGLDVDIHAYGNQHGSCLGCSAVPRMEPGGIREAGNNCSAVVRSASVVADVVVQPVGGAGIQKALVGHLAQLWSADVPPQPQLSDDPADSHGYSPGSGVAD